MHNGIIDQVNITRTPLPGTQHFIPSISSNYNLFQLQNNNGNLYKEIRPAIEFKSMQGMVPMYGIPSVIHINNNNNVNDTNNINTAYIQNEQLNTYIKEYMYLRKLALFKNLKYPVKS